MLPLQLVDGVQVPQLEEEDVLELQLPDGAAGGLQLPDGAAGGVQEGVVWLAQLLPQENEGHQPPVEQDVQLVTAAQPPETVSISVIFSSRITHSFM